MYMYMYIYMLCMCINQQYHISNMSWRPLGHGPRTWLITYHVSRITWRITRSARVQQVYGKGGTVRRRRGGGRRGRQRDVRRATRTLPADLLGKTVDQVNLITCHLGACLARVAAGSA
jgi:hypothetical protein